MKVVHVSLTPLAGSPIRIVRALRDLAGIDARLINLNPAAYGTRRFPEDLDWSKDRAEATEVVAQADVLHFHHWFDYRSTGNPFGFDFQAQSPPAAKFLMHWHSSPDFAEHHATHPLPADEQRDIAQLVVAQYHEPYYPMARPVPLIVDLPPTPESAVPPNPSTPPILFFAPSTPLSRHAERWEAKGKPEVLRILRRLEQRRVARLDLPEALPFEACQERMSRADLVIDDVVTGSFHTTSLEALALGKVCLSYLDGRTQMVLSAITQSSDLPIVNTRLEDLELALENLCRDRKLLAQLGRFGHRWMQAHYHPSAMIRHYVSAYEDLLEGRSLANARYKEDARAKQWLYREWPDLRWAKGKRALYPGLIRHQWRRWQRTLRQPKGAELSSGSGPSKSEAP